MKKLRALFHPAVCHRRRITTEDRFLAVVPLAQPHALAASQVDSWVDEHDKCSVGGMDAESMKLRMDRILSNGRAIASERLCWDYKAAKLRSIIKPTCWLF